MQISNKACHFNSHFIGKLNLLQSRVCSHNRPKMFISSLTPLHIHRLPIHEGINFKVSTLSYKVLSNQQPAYLCSLISYHQPSHSLRSSSQSLLHVPRDKTDFGRRAFFSAASQIWNHIPTAIKVSPSLVLQTSPQNTLFYLAIIFSPPSDFPAPLI